MMFCVQSNIADLNASPTLWKENVWTPLAMAPWDCKVLASQLLVPSCEADARHSKSWEMMTQWVIMVAEVL